MKRFAIMAALALAACQSPEERAAAICAGKANETDCMVNLAGSIRQSQAINSAALMATGTALYQAGQPRPLAVYPVAPMAQPPVICSRWAGGTVVCN